MNNEPLLSICIATMNRAEYLDETLASLSFGFGNEVELVIIDGSTDLLTAKVVEKWRIQHSKITYRRTPPQGVDRDYALCVENAKGKYCWLMTDDDLVTRNSVPAILDAARRNYPLIIVNAAVFNKDFSECVAESMLKIDGDIEYPPTQFREFFEETAAYLSFIGGVVIRRDIWNSRTSSPYFGTEFVHVGVIFQHPVPGTILVIAEPHIKIRYGNALWTRRAFRIWMFNWPNLIWSFSHFSHQSKQRVCAPAPYRKMSELIKSRAKGSYSIAEYHDLLSPHLTGIVQKIMAYTIALLPGRLVNRFSIVYIRNRYPDARALLIDLEQSPFHHG